MKDDLILEAINGLSRRIEKLDDKVGKLDDKVDKLDNKIDTKTDMLDNKIDNLEAKMDHKIGILQADLADFKRETRENFKSVGMALNTAMLSLDKQIKDVKAENDLEHEKFKKILKIS